MRQNKTEIQKVDIKKKYTHIEMRQESEVRTENRHMIQRASFYLSNGNFFLYVEWF